LAYSCFYALKAQKPFTFEKGKRIFHNPRTNKPWIDDGQIRKRYWVPEMFPQAGDKIQQLCSQNGQ